MCRFLWVGMHATVAEDPQQPGVIMENMTVLFTIILVPGVLLVCVIQPNLTGLIQMMEYAGARHATRVLGLAHYAGGVVLSWVVTQESSSGVFTFDHIVADFWRTIAVLGALPTTIPNFGPTVLTVAYLLFLGTHYLRLSQWLLSEMNRKMLLKRSIREGIRGFRSGNHA